MNDPEKSNGSTAIAVDDMNIQLNGPNTSYVNLDGDVWFEIEDSHVLPEFFTTPVSADDHWMFASSSGALTAGRGNSDHALFPYYSCDKISDMADASGPLTVIRVAQVDGSTVLWRPFSSAIGNSGCRRNIYKNVSGNRLLFEEVNEELSLLFRYQWSFGKRFGFVRSSEIVNLSEDSISLSILDGLQNLVPAGVNQSFQLQYSNLADAYKKSELLERAGLGIYYLSSIPTDRAEPSEGLRATVVWRLGLKEADVLLSTQQLGQFASCGTVQTEREIRGRRGAYLVQADISLDGSASRSWKIIADVDQDSSSVAQLGKLIQRDEGLAQLLADDVTDGQRRLNAIVASADGCQSGALQRAIHRHKSNVTYNLMRGGLPINDYKFDLREFTAYLLARNKRVHQQHHSTLIQLAQSKGEIEQTDLLATLEATGDVDLIRLGREYLPFTFSRRHGDPSRPWNRFSIDLYSEDGSPKIAYEGNWRDIFQNWEAVAFSWPQFTQAMIRRFVNASTADGYNPYRITQEGIDWEKPDEEEFSNIGYWGDHQIVYLLKLLEWSRFSDPDANNLMLSETGCTYARVPYRIADFQQTLVDPCNTVDYDHELEACIEASVEKIGSDGKLLPSPAGDVYQVTMLEKLLVPGLVKMTNFVPGGGIWLNTQRPEWNDANNALVGNGMSVVTACYLRRYFAFLQNWLQSLDDGTQIKVSENVVGLLDRVSQILHEHRDQLAPGISSQLRKTIVEKLSVAGSDHRMAIYENGMSEIRRVLDLETCIGLFEVCIEFLDDCILTNRREDGLFHSYNLLAWDGDSIEIERLAEMLEGQVAVISSGVLNSEQVCDLLDSLRSSRLYREDQASYTLYPDRQLPRFTEKNVVAQEWIEQSELLMRMLHDGCEKVVKKDVNGNVHFHADFRNSDSLNKTLDAMVTAGEYQELIDAERCLVADVYEKTFGHQRFTGRSENFFAYEGLGSIYWHMVSKLALAALENVVWANRNPAAEVGSETIERLKRHYVEIREGLGLNKTPAHFGAFPTDPYSHTPAGAGAKQPGMTGQVKEDVLCRMLELGARVNEGQISFKPELFDVRELHGQASAFEFVSLTGQEEKISLEPGSFAWTWCQVPIIYRRADQNRMELVLASGEMISREELRFSASETKDLFGRSGKIARINVYFDPLIWNPMNQ